MYVDVTCSASAMTCFEKRLGCIDAAEDSFQQKMINANKDIFELSLKLRYTTFFNNIIETGGVLLVNYINKLFAKIM